ncbi:MAG: transporter substrate-binding domain-containing protein, partial [Deltaproteobacteria bacterium]|nr:transporter substrate-binding domain-containing protein [Deltaproteobacteria bacterium]
DKGFEAITNDELVEIEKHWVLAPEKRYYKLPAQLVSLSEEEQVWLTQNHTVRARVGNFPPYMIFKEDEITEIVIDYLNLIAQRSGVRFEFVSETRSWQEALKSLMNLQGPDLMTSLSPMAEREPYMDFSEPYMISPRMIFIRTEAEFISSIDDLSGRTLAVPYGTLVHERIEKEYPDIGLLVYDTDLKSIEAVSTGRADAYIGNLINTSCEILLRGLTNLKVAAPTPFGDDVYVFGIRRDWPELSSIINKALDTITPAEKMAIRKKYMSIKYEHGIRIKDVLKWGLGFGGGAFLIILLIVFWNRSLATKVRERTVELEGSNKALKGEVTERTKAENELHESRDYLKNLTDSMPDAVFAVRMPERTIEWANDTFKVLGYDTEECIGRTTEFLYPSSNDYIAFGNKIARAVAEGKEVFHIEQMLRNKSGDVFPAEITSSFFKTNRELVRVTSIVKNIAERRQREQQLEEYQHRLKALASQLTIAEERERRSLAADLHDHVGHSLALARMQLNGILEAQSELERNMLVKDVSHILLKSFQDTRSLIFELSSPTLNEIGLGAAVSEWLEEHVGKRYGLKTEFIDEIDEKLRKTLDDNVRAVLFRNVRELFTNVIKHAKAEKVSCHLKAGDGMVTVIVEDDGVGFDPQATTPSGEEKGGYGLFSIQERMTDLGGSFDIQSEPGKGCKAVLTLPVGTSKD